MESRTYPNEFWRYGVIIELENIINKIDNVIR